MRGRKKTPTKLRILNGNPGRRPLPENEPQPAPGVPEPPEFLDKDARAHWDYFADLLAASGLLSLVDRMSFAALCQSCADYARACVLLSKCPELVTDPETGAPVINPIWATLRNGRRLSEVSMRSWASEFGLTPAVRARMGAVTGGQTADPFEEFVRGKKSG